MKNRLEFKLRSAYRQKIRLYLRNALFWGGLLALASVFAILISDSTPPLNDNRANATELTDLSNWCSADAAYTTADATPDEAAGSCWNNGPSHNTWFKFQATGKDILIEMKTGGSEGSLRYGYIALWDSIGNEITCAQYVSSTSDLTISHNNLTAGEWYFISVDNHPGSSGGYRGTFTLCINAGLDYDWREAATELGDLNQWCSADAAYSTLWATPDESQGTCWNNATSYNRWFKFQATGKDILIEMKTGGSEGSLRYGYIALWDSIGNEITCAQYVSSTSDLTISHNNLTAGEWYFISVDNHPGSSGGYRGTFTLCINAGLDYDWREAATELGDLNQWCSADAAYSTLWATPDESQGTCWNNATNYNRWFKFQATGKDILIEMKTGGSEGSLRYGYIALWDSIGNEITCAQYVSSTSDLTISHNNLTAGEWYFISVDNHPGSSGGYRGTFTLCINAGLDYDWREAATELGDLNQWCSADAAYSTLWATPDESQGTCWNNATNYNRWFKFQATGKDILIEMKTGGSEGSLRYGYIALWDSIGNEITCAQYVSSTSDLTISHNNLTAGEWYFVSVDNHPGSSGGYRGTFTLCINAGLDYDWREAAIELTDLHSWTSPLGTYSTLWATPDEVPGSCWNTGADYNRWFTFVAPREDVQIRLLTGGSEGTLRYGYVTLWDSLGSEVACNQYTSSTSDVEVNSASLVTGDRYYISVDNHNGSSGGYRGTFSLFIDATVLLPVEYLDFWGEPLAESVRLQWHTSQELNNNYFDIERSVDGEVFTEIGRLDGAGTSDTPRAYSFEDKNPAGSTLYYRLKQTDYDGTFTYSPQVEIKLSLSLELEAFPVPFTDALNLTFYAQESSSTRLVLLNLKGQVVEEYFHNSQNGVNRLTWYVRSALSPGVYLLRLEREDELPQLIKVVKR